MADGGDFLTTKYDLLGAMHGLADLADEAGAVTLAGDIRREKLPKIEDERFHLVVLGEFNHGKTTFVNALLGAPVLPTGVTPTTAVLHHIHWDDTPGARVVSRDGSTQDVALDALETYVVGRGSVETIRYIEVGYPASILRDRVTLVDTPGVNDLNLARAEITYSYIPRADAVLFLLDAGQILKESERVFLTERLLRANREKILFVVNKIDLLTPEEREEALRYARENLARILAEPAVFPMSATRALAGDRTGSGMDAFQKHLEEYLTSQRGRILLDNAATDALRAAAILRQNLEIKRRSFAMAAEELDARITAVEAEMRVRGRQIADRQKRIADEVADVQAWVRRDLERFVDQFAESLPAQIDRATAEDIKKHLDGFVQDAFQKWAEQEGEEIGRRLEKLAEEIISVVNEDAREVAERLARELGPTAPTVDVKVDTLAYDVGVFALGAFGVSIALFVNALVGGLLTLAAPILAVVVRQRADKEIKRRARDAAPAAVREAAKVLGPKLEENIEVFGRKLSDFVAAAGEELHRGISEVLRRSRDERSATGFERASKEAEIGGALARLEGLERGVWKLKESLWAG